MPTFCRHNRFIERCPICSAELPGRAGERSSHAKGSRRTAAGGGRATGRAAVSGGPRGRPRRDGLRVRREDRAADDGYHSELLPGVRASADARRLAEEIAFSSGRLLALAAAPVELYAEARALAAEDLEQATWICFLIAYLGPLNGDAPFAGIRLALRQGRTELAELEHIPLGPRSAHDPERGTRTLQAYRGWFAQAGSQGLAFTGDPGWSAGRRFERLFERLALPGFPRSSRFDMLVTMGRLGLYSLRADSLHIASAGASAGPSGAVDLVATACKRVFAIGDAQYLERRAGALATALSAPIEVLDVALANWGAGDRATLGFPPDTCDDAMLERARDVLGV